MMFSRFRDAIMLLCACAATAGHVIRLDGNAHPFGEITSPGFPAPYADDENVTWIVEVEEGFGVELYFMDFDLEESYDQEQGGACVYDFVQMAHRRGVSRFCGKMNHRYLGDAPKPHHRYRSHGNSLELQFVSDYSNESPPPFGFRAHYSKIDIDECADMRQRVAETAEDWDLLVYCNHHCLNFPGSYICTCRPGFALHSNQHTCIDSCGAQVLTADSGVVSSSEYPEDYSKLTDCDWTIRVRRGLSINLQFDSAFDIETHFNYTDCPYDWLKLTTPTHEEKYCGNEAPFGGNLYMTNSVEVVVNFHSDLSVEERGFRLTYNTTRIRCPDTPLAPANGIIVAGAKGWYEFEDEVTFQCDVGYDMIGNETTMCDHDGEWSAPEPTCRIKSCGNITDVVLSWRNTVPHGLDGLHFTYGDQFNVNCKNELYENTNGYLSWRCGKDGNWVSPNDANLTKNNHPRCEPICGLRGKKPPPRISGHIAHGKNTYPGAYPWMAIIVMNYPPDFRNPSLCGGSLVSDQYIVTAAHCIKGEDPNVAKVYLGAYEMVDETNFNRSIHNRQEFGVEIAHAHSEFDHPSQFNNDIALLKLDRPATISNYVKPICVPMTDEQRQLVSLSVTTSSVGTRRILKTYKKKGIIAGWGYTDTAPKEYAKTLQIARVQFVNKTECASRLQKALCPNPGNLFNCVRTTLTDNMFCAASGNATHTVDSCQGDSGGPMMFPLKNEHKENVYFLNGIVSFGTPDCGTEGSIGVYTNMKGGMVEWLENQLAVMRNIGS